MITRSILPMRNRLWAITEAQIVLPALSGIDHKVLLIRAIVKPIDAFVMCSFLPFTKIHFRHFVSLLLITGSAKSLSVQESGFSTS